MSFYFFFRFFSCIISNFQFPKKREKGMSLSIALGSKIAREREREEGAAGGGEDSLHFFLLLERRKMGGERSSGGSEQARKRRKSPGLSLSQENRGSHELWAWL